MKTSHYCQQNQSLAFTLPSLVLAVVLLTGCGSETPPVEQPPLVKVIEIADAESLSKRSFPGRARAGQEVNLSFRVSGPLIDFPAEVGSELKQGDVVARIDPQDYLNALGTAKGALQAAQAAAKKAEADYVRIQNVFEEDPGATSETAIDLTRAARDSARATVNSLQSAHDAAQDQVKYTALKAPFDGVVVETYAENFETVVAKEPVLRLLDPSSIEFVISVPENLINYAPYVEDVTVTFDALSSHALKGKIKEIGKEASRATRTYPVTLVLEQPEDAEILPGMAGSAKITARLPESSSLAAGMEIPASAIFSGEEAGKSYVWIVDQAEMTISPRQVETGRLSEYGVIILSGLSRGDVVVIKGVHSVRDGQKVRLMQDNNGGASS